MQICGTGFVIKLRDLYKYNAIKNLCDLYLAHITNLLLYGIVSAQISSELTIFSTCKAGNMQKTSSTSC